MVAARRGPALAALALAALLALPLLAGPAEAHAVPTRMVPASGAVVRAPPSEVTVAFSEAVEPSYSGVEVRDANGTVVSGPSSIDAGGLAARAPLPRDLAYGTYTLAWRALSAVDGHTTRGFGTFLFPDPSKPLTAADLPPTGQEVQVLVSPADAALRAVGFAGLFLALGAPLLALGVVGRGGPPGPWAGERRLGALALAGGSAGALASGFLAASQAAAAAQVPFLQALVDPSLAFAGRFGAMAALRVPLLLAAGALGAAAAQAGGATPRGRTAWGLALALGAGAALTVSLSSHAGALPPGTAPLAVAADGVHLLAGAAWVGGLAGLGWALLRPPGDEAAWPRIAARFSLMATAAVALLVLTGVASAAWHLKGPAALWSSDYGGALGAKLVLVAGAVALGGANRFKLLPRVERREPGALDRFGRAVRIEALLGAGVLVAAGALTAISPPAGDFAGPSGPPVVELSKVVDGVNVTLLLSPAPVRVGSAAVDVFLAEGGLSLTDATNATFRFLPPDRTLGETDASPEQVHPGHFAAEGSFFSMPGTWTLRVQVQRQAAFDVVADFPVEVAAATG